MILVVDHFDSFIYTLNRYCRESGAETHVISYADLHSFPLNMTCFKAVLLSPGPCRPADFPQTQKLIDLCMHNRIPILGVCLGHQLLAHHFGATITYAQKRIHGQNPLTYLTENAFCQDALFKNHPRAFQTMRYHSLIATQLSDSIIPLAWSEQQDLMALKIQAYPFWGVQFHPESVGTETGQRLIQNFLSCCIP